MPLFENRLFKGQVRPGVTLEQGQSAYRQLFQVGDEAAASACFRAAKC